VSCLWERYIEAYDEWIQLHLFAPRLDSDFTKHPDMINEYYFKETIILKMLFDKIGCIVSEQIWYEGSYRAQIVTYSMAYLAYILKAKMNCTLNVELIWRLQTIPDCFHDILCGITEHIKNHLYDSNRPTENIGQWCKKESCWDLLIRKKQFDISNKADQFFISLEQASDKNRASRKDQKANTKISAEIEVFNLGAPLWVRLKEFVLRQGIYTADIINALEVATKIPSKIPNSYQAKLLLKLLDESLYNGFKK
jgi:hypothetical protein